MSKENKRKRIYEAAFQDVWNVQNRAKTIKKNDVPSNLNILSENRYNRVPKRGRSNAAANKVEKNARGVDVSCVLPDNARRLCESKSIDDGITHGNSLLSRLPLILFILLDRFYF